MLRLTHWCDGHTDLPCGHRLLNGTFWTWHLISYEKHETHFHSHDQRMRDAFWLLFFFFSSLHETCGVLVPRSGTEPRPLAMKVLSPNHWTTRKFLLSASLPLARFLSLSKLGWGKRKVRSLVIWIWFEFHFLAIFDLKFVYKYTWVSFLTYI